MFERETSRGALMYVCVPRDSGILQPNDVARLSTEKDARGTLWSSWFVVCRLRPFAGYGALFTTTAGTSLRSRAETVSRVPRHVKRKRARSGA